MTYHIEDLPGRLAAGIQVNPVTGCWEWQRGKDPDGYGRVKWNAKSWQVVHRVVWTILVGPIPEDTPHLDHVRDRGCLSRACCWPSHLEPVTAAENRRRQSNGNALKTHCKHGHPFTPENTGPNKQRGDYKPSRRCLTCHRERQRARDTARRQT